ncbi:hypothetical protein WJX72_001326 [[Myrmecia] bisecta]|uniref:FAD-binding PCMH-type domain-containing protein n=1 Tax=[Myrmecia] bisecta TaxID=41462 RepID=A0AAW1PKQ2_9CHLO
MNSLIWTCLLSLLLFCCTTAAQDLSACLGAINSLATVYPQSNGYDTAKAVFNLRTVSDPAVVVYPASTADVQAVVGCARKSGTKAVPRSGGHSYEGLSVLNSSVVVDLSRNINTVEILDVAGTLARVGAGIRLGPLYYQVYKLTGRGFPAGTCPTVGAGGHFLGGGWGMLARRNGLAADHVVGIEMVDYKGDVIIANETQNTELLWASRGGGGGTFGIVTHFTISLVDVPPRVTIVQIQWPAGSPTADVMRAWQHWANSDATNPNLTTELQMYSSGTGLHGMYSGPQADAEAAVQASGLLSVGNPGQPTYKEMSYIEAVLYWGHATMGLPDNDVANLLLPPNVVAQMWPPESFKAKSYDPEDFLSDAALAVIVNNLAANPTGWIQFSSYGGAVGQLPRSQSAYAGRYSKFNMQYYVGWSDASRAQANLDWINGFQAALAPLVGPTSYVNYIDLQLPNWQQAYWGPYLQNLTAVKATFDPQNFFSNPLTIPPAQTAVAARRALRQHA